MLGLSQTPASDLAIPQRGYLALNETTDKASMLGREHEARRRNYGVATSWALAFSLAALLWGLWQLPSSILEFEECRRLDERAQALHSKILLYDEVLTMSARLCASTGDPTWDQRYRQLLDAAIKEAMALLPGAGLAASTNQANEALVFKEHRALELASRGKLTAAQAIFDDDYQKLKQTYAQGMVEFQRALLARSQTYLTNASKKLKLVGSTFLGICVSLVLVWLSIGYQTQSWNNVLATRNKDLDEQAERLRLAHQDLEESHRQLLQKQKLELVGTLATSVAHDFNNQLVPIFGHVEFMLGGERLSSEQTESLQIIQRAAKNCRQLVRRLMSLVRPAVAEKSVFELGSMVLELRDFLVQILPSTIHLEMDVAANLPSVRGTAAELQAVFLNLATNARDAMPDGGVLKISGRLRDDRVEFRVEDNGSGIEPQLLGRIFEPFYTTKAQSGTGLGLFSVQKVLQDHGATIEVESRPGRGTTFVLSFPVHGSSGPGQDKPRVESRPKQRTKILLVDDEEAVLRITSRLLTLKGFEVVTARNGVEALQVFSRERFDLVISDVTMPEMDGLTLLRRLREMEPPPKVILISGINFETANTTGASAVLNKPFELSQLLELIECHAGAIGAD